MKKKIQALCSLLTVSLLTACCLSSDGSSSKPGLTVPSQPQSDINVRVTTLEESPTLLSVQVADNIISQSMETMTVDYDCFSMPACREQIVRIKSALPGIKIRIYVNSMELFAYDNELNQRPVQQQISQWVNANAPGYYLHDTNGQNVIWWNAPTMYMMNLSSSCPAVDGRVWSEYLIDTLYDQIYEPNRSLISGIEFDNLWPYVSFVNEARSIEIDLNNDGVGEDFWTLERQWRAGIFEMIDYARQRFPADFVVTGRSFHYRYAPAVDGLTFEAIFAPYMSDALQGGAFARVDRWIRLTQNGGYSTLNEERGTAEQNMTNYAISLLGNGYVSLDGGPSGHGIFYPFAEYVNLGQPKGPVEYPYQELFDSNSSWAGLQGSYSQTEPGWIRLDPGQTISLPVEAGYQVQFYYQIINGQYCSSELVFAYPGMPPDGTPGEFDAHRWMDGEYYGLADATGQATWTFNGPGYALLTNMVVRDTTQSPSYFLRKYERGLVLYNPGNQPIGVNVEGHGSYRLEPGQGQIVVY